MTQQGPIAYVVARYPAVSHTFIQREVAELRSRDVVIDTYSVREVGEDQALSADDIQSRASTEAILPVSFARLVTSHFAAVRTSPKAYVATLRYALGRGGRSPRALIWQAFYFAEAMILWHSCRAKGTRHLHAHMANVACDVVRLAAKFGTASGEHWTWSFTMHGSMELFRVDSFGLADKVRDADFVVCISEFTRSQLMWLVESEHWAKLSVVHCGVDVDRFAPVERRRRREHSLDVLTVGRLHEVKLQRLLIDAVIDLNRRRYDVRLTIVGDGPLAGELQAHVRSCGAEDFVHMEGAVGQDDIATYFDAADAFCLPSAAEGVPVVVMEAMAAGLPCVVSRITGVPELIEDGVSGLLVTPGRAKPIADALEKLALDVDFRAAIGEQARKSVIDNFEVGDCGAQLAALFADSLGWET